MTGRRIPEAVKQKIIQEYVDNKPAFLTLAARHNVSYVSVRKILHDAEVVDPRKNTRDPRYGLMPEPRNLGVTRKGEAAWSEYDRELLRMIADGVGNEEILREVRRRKLRLASESRAPGARYVGEVTRAVILKDTAELYGRLGAKNRAHAVKLAYEKGLLSVPCAKCGHDPDAPEPTSTEE